MDFRVGQFAEGIVAKRFSRIAEFSRPAESLRVMVDRAPQAEAFAASLD